MKITFDTSRWGYTYLFIVHVLSSLLCFSSSRTAFETYLIVTWTVLLAVLFIGMFVESWNNGKVVKK